MPETVIASRYRLDSLIASGGMGAVWRGHDTRLDRPVAVKLLKNTVFEDNERARARFEREARAAAKLRGSGIVAVHDHGEDAVGDETVAYLVMELVEGESLSAILDRDGGLPPARVLEITAAVAETLDSVHRLGIVHRDVKPANILIDADGTVKLVDFGIARVDGVTSLTSSGVSLGTLTYASPEQLTAGEITGSTDVYALGAVAYECLAGRPPFDSSDQKTVVAAHLSAEPPPIDGVPAAVADVVLRALAKAPEDRWASGSDFAEACRAALRDEPTVRIGAPVPSRPAMSAATVPDMPEQSEPSRRPWKLGLVAAAAAVLLAAAALIWSPWQDSPDARISGQESTTGVPGDTTTTPTEDPSTFTESPSGTDDSPETTTGGGDAAGEDDGDESGGDTGEAEQEAPAPQSVPSVVGSSSGDARSELAAAGFENLDYWMPNPYFYSPFPEQCEVVSQSPEAGTTADSGDVISLEVFDPSNEGCP